MKYMLYTNICIYLIKRKPPHVLERFQTHQPGDIFVSSITVAELQYGVEKSNYQDRNQIALDLFLSPLEIADFETRAAQRYGHIRAQLDRNGAPIGAYDLLIAGHAQSLDMTLVTNNSREFSRVPDLKLENWVP